MQKCELTGKGKQFGNNISFSQRHTKKVWKPNLQTKTFMLDGKKVTMKLSTQAIRTLKKKGVLTNAKTINAEKIAAKAEAAAAK
jgi:large subunit ribosomal protein L28